MKNFLITLLCLTVLMSCGPSLRVSSDYTKDLKVSSFKTFSWLDMKAIERKGNDPRYMNELTDKRIKVAVTNELAIRGIKLLDGKGDLELHYHIIVDDKTMVVTEPTGTRFNPDFEKRTSTFQYKEGTLIIDMMDTKTSELIWRGSATDVITEKAAKKPEESINYAVKEILKKSPFPLQ